jgi:hypothetical protein
VSQLPIFRAVCLNQHHWLAIRMREEGIDFQQCTNAFLQCGNPARLQELAGSLTAQDRLKCGQKWLAAFTPFFSDNERKQASFCGLVDTPASTPCGGRQTGVHLACSGVPRWNPGQGFLLKRSTYGNAQFDAS